MPKESEKKTKTKRNKATPFRFSPEFTELLAAWSKATGKTRKQIMETSVIEHLASIESATEGEHRLLLKSARNLLQKAKEHKGLNGNARAN